MPRRAKPVTAPFPYVPAHVIKPETIRTERLSRSSSHISVFCGVLSGESTLPDVALVLSVGGKLPTPWISGLIDSASGRILPLGLRKQPLIRPFAVSLGIAPRNVNYRMVHSLEYIRTGSLRFPPGRPLNGIPPIQTLDGLRIAEFSPL